MAIQYKLDAFEGPLDVLLHLIDRAEIDIQHIPISEITDQYLEFLQTMQNLELEITSEFLVMAATLLSIKSKMLLPAPPPPEQDGEDWLSDGLDPRAELAQQLIEYRKYKEIAEQLREKEWDRSLLFSREPLDLAPFQSTVPVNPVEGIGTFDLMLAFRRALHKQMNRNRIARVRRDEISVKDRMNDVMAVLRERGGRLLFSKLFHHEMDRVEIVATFLALLELMKLHKVNCYQTQVFDEIVIQVVEEDRP